MFRKIEIDYVRTLPFYSAWKTALYKISPSDLKPSAFLSCKNYISIKVAVIFQTAQKY